ncbi:integral membrane sensor signal transduction histidine kinase [Paenibacillus vortex V453]|uniref:histidine kinase n=1 Tax=Paenibacillus vortex V453 TaxID=715225 RepID=A0A2R9SNI4_9BACL|nr:MULTISPECIES: HAMP domain-containing sensor histidine kinase [Paenibacillus]ANA78959.1 two-component sensor histidine kinase [Paenibacillus glucanolyticus]AVV57123.1 sensor histidine kinase [Paenibacillus glucanolyticus]AWP26265.1 two-component sensor histidine kinase [Paenibacillus sp. Cedars]EFU38919.1 integral membrane sensor signal transduction histidine kinase [Paenibacillus vortex V453]ETT32187.1 integral membrane sensor signal transduction histidine kinase [Paenibacillus sp. FSL R5-8
MKFWLKTLLVVLVLFVVALDISVVMIMNKSWSLNTEREIQRASSEQALIANNIYENLTSIMSRGSSVDDEILHNVTYSYAKNYLQQGVTLQLWNQEQLLYPKDMNHLIKPDIPFEQIEEQGIHYIQFSHKLPPPYDHLLLVYTRDIEELYDNQRELNRFFVTINFTISPALMILLFLFIRQLTKPLRLLSKTTKHIAEGDYSERVLLYNKDEFGELSQNFNRMAEAIEQRMHELSEMAEEKQRIVDNLAHELRTPLTSMQGFAEYLRSANIGEEERGTATHYIWTETMRLKSLAFKLLDLSVVGRKPLELQRIPVEELFNSVQQTEMKNMRDSRIKLIVHRDIDYVYGDFDLLATFLVNCLENSIHASVEGGEIRLMAYELDEEAVLEVRDFGIGMTAQQVARAFEPFYRADSARSREHGGAGLGLSLCRQIAEAHDARLSLQSKQHSGTSVHLILQLHNNSSTTP